MFLRGVVRLSVHRIYLLTSSIMGTHKWLAREYLLEGVIECFCQFG